MMIDLAQKMESTLPALGQTLLHSLWQGLLIYCLLSFILAVLKVDSSKIRYNFSVAALSVYLISCSITFMWFFNPSINVGGGIQDIQILFENGIVTPYEISFSAWVSQNMNLILMIWGVGVIIMVIRLLGGWYMLTRIKQQAINCTNKLWLNKLDLLKARLKVTSAIVLKISNQVDVPMVFGTIKPIIIFPATLLTGLSEDQLEIILAHELAHVKRYDFIVNVLQHIVEVAFFFNPFVWLISNIIRTERENACDDLALSVSGDSYSLASTLLRVEEIRRQPQLALYFSNNNNIFNRIKRLTGMKTQNLFDTRMVILVLLAASLMSFGWYSIRANAQEEKTKPNEVEVLEDPQVDIKVDTQLEVDADPDEITETTPVSDSNAEALTDLKPVLADSDTSKKGEEDEDAWRYDRRIPPPPAPPALPPFPPTALDEWTAAFSEKFSEQFADFYEDHGEEMEEMMAELRESLKSVDFERIEEARFIKEMALRQKEIALTQTENMRLDEKRSREEAERSMALAKELMEREREGVRYLREVDLELKLLEGKMKKFDKELTQELVKDGYIKSSETIETLHVDRDGQFMVNGVKVKEKDSKKYSDIYRKYFDEDIKGLRYNN